MRAQNLSVSVPYHGCNKNCPYCISKMTGRGESNFDAMMAKAYKVKNLAMMAGISSVSFTGKGEPLLGSAYDELLLLLAHFNDLPCEIQTNGKVFLEDRTILPTLSERGINVIATSIDSRDQFIEMEPVFKEIKALGMIPRITVNLVPETYKYSPIHWAQIAKDYGVMQMSFRKVDAPKRLFEDQKAYETQKWVETEIIQSIVDDFMISLKKLLVDPIMKLPYGATLYNYDGMSITYFDYCIQDKSNGDDIRSLIFREDGYLATTWDTDASILF